VDAKDLANVDYLDVDSTLMEQFGRHQLEVNFGTPCVT
jgi:hypothetical protein